MKKRVLAAVFAVSLTVPLAVPMPAAAHQGHTSCREVGQFAAFLAHQGGLGEEASALARTGPNAVSTFVAGAHTALCEPSR